MAPTYCYICDVDVQSWPSSWKKVYEQKDIHSAAMDAAKRGADVRFHHQHEHAYSIYHKVNRLVHDLKLEPDELLPLLNTYEPEEVYKLTFEQLTDFLLNAIA